ncbi:MAG: phospholipase D-like domain-containing protein, partial [Mycoplasma sp.]
MTNTNKNSTLPYQKKRNHNIALMMMITLMFPHQLVTVLNVKLICVDAFDWLWSHHEKLVVIDQKLSYVGGLDLCWGRYDTNKHPLYEPENQFNSYFFPGIDYSNARICDFINVNKYWVESVSRKKHCRMPWHDVHIRLEGPVCVDIARHFVERWNFERFEDKTESITNVKTLASANKVVNKKKEGWLNKFVEKVENEEDKKSNQDNQIIELKERDNNKNEEHKYLAKSKTIQDEFLKINPDKKENQLFNENENENNTQEIIFKDNNNAESDILNNLQKNFLLNKTIIDEDHLMRWTEYENKESTQKKDAYSALLNKITSSKKPQTKEKKEEMKLLVPKVYHGLFKKGTRSKVQVLRSASRWSIGINKTENSIWQAYYHLIEKSKHYIYIENQFCISKSFTEEERKECKYETSKVVQNEIALRLRLRIEKAYKEKEKFHVFVFIPLLPGFAGEPNESGTWQIIWKHTYESISHNKGLSLFEKLKEIMSEDEISNYISFYSLRGHTRIDNVPITELIYIHSKLMIIDDNKVLIGSANINDRSMLGTRDSEYAVIVKEERNYPSKMNDQNYECAKFAATFRIALMAEHMGLSPKDPILIDPLNDKFLSLIQERARNNTLIYRDLFGCYPDDTYNNFKSWQQRKTQSTSKEIIELQQKYEIRKNEIIGHIVEFPKDFWQDEKLGINFFA